MALLPPFFLETVVAIGVGNDPNKRHWIGTGFLFGKVVDTTVQITDRKYKVWLITNKHVLADIKNIYIKFNSAKEPNSKDYKIELIAQNGRPRWIGHSDDKVDVAAIMINPNFLKQEDRKYQFFQSDTHIMDKGAMIKNEITEGDGVFVLGFPMGMVTPDRQYVICRNGSIARIRDFLENKTTDFLIDAMVFPGNSGGPVVTCPSGIAIQGTNTLSSANLIGIVKSYVPYQDVAVSIQTKQTRVIFEENTGLTAIESVSSIMETIALAEKRIKGRIAQTKNRQKKKEMSTKIKVLTNGA